MLDDFLYRVTATSATRRWLIPLARAYVRYAPVAAGKDSFWTRVVNPYLAWHSHKFVAATVFGRRIAGDTADMIQQYLYYFGVWEPALTQWVARQLAPGDTFVDVGANIGYYSLLASTLVGRSGTVVAIEPSPNSFRALQGNLARNRTHNVRAVNVAASDREGVLKLFRGPGHNTGEATLIEKDGFPFECEVRAAPLSTILCPDEVKNARLIKIDVEGAEASVLEGMRPLLGPCRSDLEVIVEVHPRELLQQGRSPEEVLSWFSDAGFRAYALEADYSPLSCLARDLPTRPVRMGMPARAVHAETVVVFSRRDSEFL